MAGTPRVMMMHGYYLVPQEFEQTLRSIADGTFDFSKLPPEEPPVKLEYWECPQCESSCAMVAGFGPPECQMCGTRMEPDSLAPPEGIA